MLGLRILSSVVILPPVIAAIWFGGYYFVALMVLVGAAMAWEVSNLAGLAHAVSRYIVVILGGITPVLASELAWGLLAIWPFLAVVIFVALTWSGYRDSAERLGFVVLSFLVFSAIISLIWLRFWGLGRDGAALVLYLVLIVTATDVGGYFAGRMIGGPKLAPRISPNKTWAGLIGGTLLAGLAAYGLAIGVSAADLMLPVALGVILAPIAQIGDLTESWIKRRRGVKDSGNLIPGHGGILDRVDGYLTAAPTLTLMAILNKGGPFA